MDSTTLTPLIDWIGAHPAWVGAAVGATAFFESLALIGLIVPGAVLLFALGALVAAGELDLLPVLAWGVAGALTGDGLSFWLGYRYREHLPEHWPFRLYPQALAQGRAFVQRHGGKSLILGRFIGPLRPFVPAVAGMLHMPVPRYVAIAGVGALAWSPAYILPGVVLGHSVGFDARAGWLMGGVTLLGVALLFAAAWFMRRVVLR